MTKTFHNCDSCRKKAKDMENKGQSLLRKFGLSSASINNRMTVMVVLFILVIAGVASYIGMPREAFPEVGRGGGGGGCGGGAPCLQEGGRKKEEGGTEERRSRREGEG